MKAITALVAAFKITKDADGARDGLQAHRITELEERMDAKDREHDLKDQECNAKIDRLNSRIVAVAHSTMELSTVVEKHDPASPALARAKLALQHAFPLDFNTPGDMLKKSRELGEME